MHLALQGTTRQVTPFIRQCSLETGGCRSSGLGNVADDEDLAFAIIQNEEDWGYRNPTDNNNMDVGPMLSYRLLFDDGSGYSHRSVDTSASVADGISLACRVKAQLHQRTEDHIGRVSKVEACCSDLCTGNISFPDLTSLVYLAASSYQLPPLRSRTRVYLEILSLSGSLTILEQGIFCWC